MESGLPQRHEEWKENIDDRNHNSFLDQIQYLYPISFSVKVEGKSFLQIKVTACRNVQFHLTFCTAPSLWDKSFSANIFWVEKHSPFPSSLAPLASLVLAKQDRSMVVSKSNAPTIGGGLWQ